MAVSYRVGDLIQAAKSGKVSAIAHGCNCFNTMKSGIAPEIAKAFPEAWRADQETTKGDRGKLGYVSYSFNTGHNLHVFNLYSQYGYWNRKKGIMDLNYEALDHALWVMKSKLDWICYNDYPPEEFSVGIPKIGAGLAGGDWGIIEPMIKKHLGHFNTVVYVLKGDDIVQH